MSQAEALNRMIDVLRSSPTRQWSPRTERTVGLDSSTGASVDGLKIQSTSSSALGQMVRIVALGVAPLVILVGCSGDVSGAKPTVSSVEMSAPASVFASPTATPTPTEGATETFSASIGPPSFAIEAHKRDDLRNYSEFTYQTATLSGLSGAAAATANERIAAMVDGAVNEAVAGDDRDAWKESHAVAGSR